MLSLPQSPKEAKTNEEPITITTHEPADVLEPFLLLLSGLPIAQSPSFELFESILLLAERWESPGPISYLRSSLTSPSFLHPSTNALKLYALATHLQWAEEAKIAASHTLELSLYDEEHQPTLELLAPRDLMSLFRLHRTRRDAFKTALDSPTRFTAGNVDPFYCGACSTVIDNSSWRQLKASIFEHVDRNPLGSDFIGIELSTATKGEGGESKGTKEWEAVMAATNACWVAKCCKPSCGSLNYDRSATMKQISRCALGLGDTLELRWD